MPGNFDTDIAWKSEEMTSGKWQRKCLGILTQKLSGKMWSTKQYRNIKNCKQVPAELREKLERKKSSWKSQTRYCLKIVKHKLPGKMRSGEQYGIILNCKQVPGELCGISQ